MKLRDHQLPNKKKEALTSNNHYQTQHFKNIHNILHLFTKLAKNYDSSQWWRLIPIPGKIPTIFIQ